MENKSLIPRQPRKTEFVAFKLTPAELAKIKTFCKEKELTQSELYRYATLSFIEKNSMQ